MTNERKIEIHDELVFYLVELIRTPEDLRHTLHAIGFTSEETDEVIWEAYNT